MITIEELRLILGWCTLINYGILILWFLFYLFGREFLYRLHGKWFKLTPEQFDKIHYKGMAYYKIGILLFNLAPYIAIRIIG